MKLRAAWRHILLIARCMGSIPAWASRVMFEVVHMAPVMKMEKVRWMHASFVAKVVDPRFFFSPGAGLRMGLHHNSAA